VVVKTTEEDQLVTDLTETFTNPREFQWKLNPTKCVFGVPFGLLLGFMVGHRGIEANPVKVDAICNMVKPSIKKDVMKLTGMMAALCRFIRNSARKAGLPHSTTWIMYFDSALNFEVAGAGILLISPQGEQLKYVLQIHYKASDNGAE
jgi:hypothetical protein